MSSKLRFHDDHLEGVTIHGKDIVLTIRKLKDTLWRVRLVDVSLFKADDFLKGNIILDVTVLKTSDVDPATLRGMLQPLEESGYMNEASFQRILAHPQVLFELAPSYGCEITALCSDVVFEQCDTH